MDKAKYIYLNIDNQRIYENHDSLCKSLGGKFHLLAIPNGNMTKILYAGSKKGFDKKQAVQACRMAIEKEEE